MFVTTKTGGGLWGRELIPTSDKQDYGYNYLIPVIETLHCINLLYSLSFLYGVFIIYN